MQKQAIREDAFTVSECLGLIARNKLEAMLPKLDIKKAEKQLHRGALVAIGVGAITLFLLPGSWVVVGWVAIGIGLLGLSGAYLLKHARLALERSACVSAIVDSEDCSVDEAANSIEGQIHAEMGSYGPFDAAELAGKVLKHVRGIPGRNAPCSCDSGKKYKNCCYNNDQVDVASLATAIGG